LSAGYIKSFRRSSAVHGRDCDEMLTGGVHTSRGHAAPEIERQLCTWGMMCSVQAWQGTQRAPVPDGQSEQQPDWLYLAQLIKERRMELGLTQAQVHSAGGPAPPRSIYLKMDVVPLLVLRSSVGSSVPWNGAPAASVVCLPAGDQRLTVRTRASRRSMRLEQMYRTARHG